MFSFRTTPLLSQEDIVLRKGKLAILCNQSAWYPNTSEYIYETFAKTNRLTTIFTPDKNLFFESSVLQNVNKIYLERDSEQFFAENVKLFLDIDALIIETQDSGCRYSSNIAILYNLFKVLKNNDIELPIYVIDKQNPQGRLVEGTMLRAGYRSNLGIEGIPHKHGLTIGEELYYIYNELNAKFPLHIISYKTQTSQKELLPWSIPISDNFAGLFTVNLYCGQKLWEATNVSCGKGTTRPYEIFGAPFIKEMMNKQSWKAFKEEFEDEGVYMREICFIPDSNIYKGEKCYGFQLIIKPNMQYHSLAHILKIMRVLLKNCQSFKFDTLKNAENDKTAFECMLGDKDLIDYVNGKASWTDTKEHIKIEEQKWIRKAKKAILYEQEQLYRIK